MIQHRVQNTPSKYIFPFLFTVIACSLLFPSRATAWSGSDLPEFNAFIEEVSNGNAGELRGIYVRDVLAEKVVYQPNGGPTFISSRPNTLTVFGMASNYHSTGLLAHNTLAGAEFSMLEPDQIVYLIYGDGMIEPYIIREFLRYQALEPNSVTSAFVDLETGETLSVAKLFLNVFDRPGDLILQTCIYADGEDSWGRLFIIAEPYVYSLPATSGLRFD
jgi:hypothetical protein